MSKGRTSPRRCKECGCIKRGKNHENGTHHQQQVKLKK